MSILKWPDPSVTTTGTSWNPTNLAWCGSASAGVLSTASESIAARTYAILSWFIGFLLQPRRLMEPFVPNRYTPTPASQRRNCPRGCRRLVVEPPTFCQVGRHRRPAPCIILSFVIGQSPRRKEDERLITGRGRFIDDVILPGLLHLALVRSTHARARIVEVDAAAAPALPAVAVFLAWNSPAPARPPPAAGAG